MQTPIQIFQNKPERTCGECTKCCEGSLSGEIKLKDGRVYQLGPTPCPVLQLGKGCAEYENRPENPCVGFSCEWLRHPDVYPEEMRPDRAGAIFSLQNAKGVGYLRITEAGQRLDSEVLSFGIKLALMNKFNLYWEIDGSIHWFGNKDFITIMNEERNNNLIKDNEAKK